MTPYELIDPDAPVIENVDAVLSYLDEVEMSDARERADAAALCERARHRIATGRPPLSVLHAALRGVAPGWAVADLRRALAA